MKDRLAAANRADLNEESTRIVERLRVLLPTEGYILAFEPLRDEPDITPIVDELRASARLALITGRGEEARLEAVSMTGSRPLESSDVVLALVPGRAFDQSGARLGRGGGTFDRVLATLNCPRIGVAFACQIVDRVPREEFDLAMNSVITGTQTA